MAARKSKLHQNGAVSIGKGGREHFLRAESKYLMESVHTLSVIRERRMYTEPAPILHVAHFRRILKVIGRHSECYWLGPDEYYNPPRHFEAIYFSPWKPPPPPPARIIIQIYKNGTSATTAAAAAAAVADVFVPLGRWLYHIGWRIDVDGWPGSPNGREVFIMRRV